MQVTPTPFAGCRWPCSPGLSIAESPRAVVREHYRRSAAVVKRRPTTAGTLRDWATVCGAVTGSGTSPGAVTGGAWPPDT
jgi:hypothetical protein